ncbi:MAG: sulfurtransferase [Thermomonas sp.]|uniref:sulfurtransferase n=1 Tax=Thermomonas sp. TaxID=1971895 RepID=UPI0039E64B8D
MILNIAAYLFVAIDDVDALTTRLRERACVCDLRGTVLVAPEGINLFLAGDADTLRGFLDWLRADPRFAALHAKESWSDVVPFAKLKVKRKAEIIAFRREQASPLDTGERAPAVDPPTLARWLAQGHDDAGKRVVLLDTRNREEFGFGTFKDALTLPIDNFTDLPAALAPHREALRDATVVSFCTGGIRCEKAALWLRHDGMHNLLQLDGGILGYFEQVGGAGYDGRCFVFDERVALDAQLKPLVDGASAEVRA